MNDKETLAAEYVLGTLSHNEREEVAVARLSDPELVRLIEAWEHRLEPLLDTVDDATPKSDLFKSIDARLESMHSASDQKQVLHSKELLTMRQQLVRWRISAMGGFGLAAGLLCFILLSQPEPLPIPASQHFVAVFQQDDQQPSFLMSIDLVSRQLTVRPITAETAPGKTYQLWIKSDELGPNPFSLGLLESVEKPTLKQINTYSPDILKSATFGISLEPEGGSPTGQPTGPAIHGTLYPASV